jgi:hypothetical protein
MKKILNSRAGAVAAGAAVLVVVGGSGTAVFASGLVGSADIRDNSIRSVDIRDGGVHSVDVRDGAVHKRDLSDGVKTALAEPGPVGPQGEPGLSNLEADGPYPGATDLGGLTDQGDNSDEMVAADAARHTVWVQCAPGKVALGGGFRLAADSTQEAAESINVLASEPTQVKDGAIVYDPIAGDEAGSIQPNGWLVEVVNNGTTDQIVRPWVVCATVAQSQ